MVVQETGKRDPNRKAIDVVHELIIDAFEQGWRTGFSRGLWTGITGTLALLILVVFVAVNSAVL